MRQCEREGKSVKDNSSERVYLTPQQVADRLMVSTASVRLWASNGLLPAVTTAGGHRRFLAEDIGAFEQARRERTEERRGLDLLVITDDDQLSRLVQTLLCEHPEVASVAVAGGLFDAGREFERRHPSVLMLDLPIPGLDVIELSKALNSTSATVNLRLVGVGSPDFLETATDEAAAFDAFVSKPFDEATLLEILSLDLEPV
jgi:excisionase family DNA binding protein